MPRSSRPGSPCAAEGHSELIHRFSGQCVGGLPHAEDMVGGARPNHPKLKRGRPKKINVKESDDPMVAEGEGRLVKNRMYPLRARTLGNTLTCRVLLTRLEQSIDEDKTHCLKCPVDSTKDWSHTIPSRTLTCKFQQKICKANPQAVVSDRQSEAIGTLPVTEPRKRRLASLNAEAVNSLLLYRENPQRSKLTKNLQVNRELANTVDILGQKATQGDATGAKLAKSDIGSSRKAKNIEDMGLLILYRPSPRRQASLNAAAMLQISSTSFKAKQRAAKASIKKVRTRTPHAKLKKEQRRKFQLLRRCGNLCKSECCKQEPRRAGSAEGKGSLGSGFQCRCFLGNPLKFVKTEPVETQLTPLFCCSQGGLMEYCHSMALFLGQKSFGDSKLKDCSLPEGKFPCPQSVAHPHSLSIGRHPYPCFSGYYVHFAQHENSSSQVTPASSSPMPFTASSVAPIALCPVGVQTSKRLSPTGSHSSGIAHPVHCYGEPCPISSYPYRSVPNLGSSRCCYTAGCSSCSIWTEDYSKSLEDQGTSSIRLSPSVPRLRTAPTDPLQPRVPLLVTRRCPRSAKPPGGSRTEVPGGAPNVCSDIQDRRQLGPTSHTASAAAKPQINTRRRATNGWLPVGQPFQKEVFTVGEESTVLRTCFEAVQRDGEVVGVRDTVLLRSGPKKSLPYVAKISALWEDSESGEMMMSLFWYYRPEHTQGGRNSNTHYKCYVLTLAQYCRFCALGKRRAECLPESATRVVPSCVEYAAPSHCCVPRDIEAKLVFVCRHVYDFRYGRILKNLQ
ncbi:hypothetical protein UPYG_G00230120 [Umbra pygmaea]|uniref:BAH domain-containing protein n=1 Tax=Umbra pygmaea TaxID=75934 RepID=A0ABD0WXM0_UMBPY